MYLSLRQEVIQYVLQLILPLNSYGMIHEENLAQTVE